MFYHLNAESDHLLEKYTIPGRILTKEKGRNFLVEGRERQQEEAKTR